MDLLWGSRARNCDSEAPSERKSNALPTAAPPVPEMISTFPVPLRFGSKDTVA